MSQVRSHPLPVAKPLRRRRAPSAKHRRKPAAKFEVAAQRDTPRAPAWRRIGKRTAAPVLVSALLNALGLALLCWLTLAAEDKSRLTLVVDGGEIERAPEVLEVVIPNPEPVESTSQGAGEVEQELDLSDVEMHLFELSNATTTSDDSAELASRGAQSGGGGGSGGGGTVNYHGIAARADSVAYVVDASNSMLGRRFGHARMELMYSISRLDSSQSFCVAFFSNRKVMTFPPRGLQLVPATAENVRKFHNWVKRVGPGGNTYPAAALKRSLLLRPDAVFFLTDGKIPADTIDVARDVRLDPTRIHTVAFQSSAGETLLREISQLTGGIYRFAE